MYSEDFIEVNFIEVNINNDIFSNQITKSFPFRKKINDITDKLEIQRLKWEPYFRVHKDFRRLIKENLLL